MGQVNFVEIEGTRQYHHPKSRVLRPTNKHALIKIVVALRENPVGDDIEATVAAQSAQKASERTFIDADTQATVHGAAQADIDAASSYITAAGLHIADVNQADRTMTVMGTAKQLEDTFKVGLADMVDADGNEYRGQVGAVHVPDALSGIITHVMDLSDRAKCRPHFVRPNQATLSQQIVYPSGLFAQAMNVPQVTADGSNGTVAGPDVVIGLFELGGTDSASDQQAYCAKYGYANPRIVHISVAGNVPTSDPTGANVEVALDEDVAMGMAPGCTILVYDAANTTAGVIAMINLAKQHAVSGFTIPGTTTTVFPKSFSMSWGGSETADWSAADMQSVNTALANLCAVGGTAGFSAGDAGSADGQTDGLAHPDFPGTSPYGLCHGGLTAILNKTTGQTESATTWGGSAAVMAQNGGGGGGVSAIFAAPTYQTQNGINAVSANPPHNPGRAEPDDSGIADPMTATDTCSGGTFEGVGGTSSSSPQSQTGIAILVAANGGKGFGLINTDLYAQQGKTYVEVTTGTNGAYDASNDLGNGYNLCTGWGLPNYVAIGQSLGLTLGPGSLIGTNPPVATPMAQETAAQVTPPTPPATNTTTPPASPTAPTPPSPTTPTEIVTGGGLE